MINTTNIALTNDTLKNILIMAPLLDEAGQNKVFGLMCGLMSNKDSSSKSGHLSIRDQLNNVRQGSVSTLN